MKRNKVILIIIFLLLSAGAAAAYYFYYLPQQEPPEQEETPPAEQGPATQEFEGEHVGAEIPEDWTIVEYQDGAGTTMLVDGASYTGLTALEIKNPAGNVIFALRGVYGIGGTGACANYFRFADDSTAYYNAVVATNTEVGENPPTVVDLTASSYSSVDLFDARVRRIGTKLYWDTEPGTAATFEAACGIQEGLFDFGAPQFTIVGQGTDGIYQWVVLNSASAEDLTALDAILNSLTTTP